MSSTCLMLPMVVFLLEARCIGVLLNCNRLLLIAFNNLLIETPCIGAFQLVHFLLLLTHALSCSFGLGWIEAHAAEF